MTSKSATSLLVLRVVRQGGDPSATQIRITRLDDALAAEPATESIQPRSQEDVIEYVRQWYQAAVGEAEPSPSPEPQLTRRS